MLDSIDLKNILFLDIETVPMVPVYDELPDHFKKLWDRKSERIASSENDTPETLFGKAGIFAEFGKIVCISVGCFREDFFRIKSFFDDDEKKLLSGFIDLLNNHFHKPNYRLCAHNGKEFDFPYIARRILINELKIPLILDYTGKKPWEVPHLDTMEMWKFGDYKNFTSLELLATIFNIPTPKDDIAGSDVAQVYWQDNDLQRIATYCQKDVLTIAQLVRRFKHLPLLKAEEIKIV